MRLYANNCLAYNQKSEGYQSSLNFRGATSVSNCHFYHIYSSKIRDVYYHCLLLIAVVRYILIFFKGQIYLIIDLKPFTKNSVEKLLLCSGCLYNAMRFAHKV